MAIHVLALKNGLLVFEVYMAVLLKIKYPPTLDSYKKSQNLPIFDIDIMGLTKLEFANLGL